MGNTRTGAREFDKDNRREEGIERNAAWKELSSAAKLASLDGRLGKGVGASRQRKKLA